MSLRAAAAVLVLISLAACGVDYRPGGSNVRPLPQNLPANGVPEAPGARPR